MFLLELLICLFIILLLAMGTDNISLPRLAIIMAVFAGLMIAFHMVTSRLLAYLMSGRFEAYKMASRRHIIKQAWIPTGQEKRLESMEEPALRAYLESHPTDALACEILCERLRDAGHLADYARELQYLLMLPNQMSIEEKCSRYHELADLYLGPLESPGRAAEALNALIAAFPQHYQATLARRRLKDISSLQDQG